jgi:sulfotransferase family protein
VSAPLLIVLRFYEVWMRTAVPSRKTFLLGIGCQKGGTSWLYDYLAHHPEVATGYGKEYHVLDAHYRDYFGGYHQRRIAEKTAQVATLRRSAAPDREARAAELVREIANHRRSQALAADLDAYVAHFAELAEANPRARLVCDITPSYCVLRAPDWAEVRRMFEAAGFEVRVAFLLRDPIERMNSAYQMGLRTNDRRAELVHATGALPGLRADLGRRLRASLAGLRRGVAHSPEARAARDPFLAFAMDEINLLRSQYDKTMAELDAVFEPDAVHYAFYETFFTDAALRRFTEFAGIGFVPGNYGVRTNVSTRLNPLSGFEVAYLRERLADTYAFCGSRFGPASVEPIWPHY